MRIRIGDALHEIDWGPGMKVTVVTPEEDDWPPYPDPLDCSIMVFSPTSQLIIEEG